MKRKAKRILQGFNNPMKAFNQNAQHHDGMGTSMPPNFNVVLIYFDQKGLKEQAIKFLEEYQLSDWKSKLGHPITNWKVCAAEWIFNHHLELKRKLRQSPFSSDY